jgi:hypothetical protein
MGLSNRGNPQRRSVLGEYGVRCSHLTMRERIQLPELDKEIRMLLFGLLLFSIWFVVIACAGLLIGSLIMGIAEAVGRWAAPLKVNRGWLAVLAVVGCFAWYPVHGVVDVRTVPTSIALAVGICIAMSL